uniref:Uncharacterized protein n=1 Tax=Rhizophora mucronata TaxID=61149 RepID=A0A2P2NKS6_RHIMU
MPPLFLSFLVLWMITTYLEDQRVLVFSNRTEINI